MRLVPHLRVLALLLLVAVAGGCANHAQISKDMLTLSPQSMRNRQLQTKRYDTNDEKMMLTASASVLQDLGFQIDESTPDLGIIVGSKTRDATDAGQVTMAIFVAALGGGSMPVDKQQTIRVSLVTAPMARPKDKAAGAAPAQKLTPKMIDAACARISAKLQLSLDDELRSVLPQAELTQAEKALTEQFARELNGDLTMRMKNQDYGATRVRVTFQRVVMNTQGFVSRMEALETPELYKEFYEKLSKSVFLEANDI